MQNYYQLAIDEKQNSDDPKTQVGAVIVLNDKIISKSANILPPRLNVEVVSENRYHVIEHAERAAIFKAEEMLDGATIYCTRFPCVDCARAISFSGITKATFQTGIEKDSPWAESQYAAEDIMKKSNIEIVIGFENG